MSTVQVCRACCTYCVTSIASTVDQSSSSTYLSLSCQFLGRSVPKEHGRERRDALEGWMDASVAHDCSAFVFDHAARSANLEPCSTIRLSVWLRWVSVWVKGLAPAPSIVISMSSARPVPSTRTPPSSIPPLLPAPIRTSCAGSGCTMKFRIVVSPSQNDHELLS